MFITRTIKRIISILAIASVLASGMSINVYAEVGGTTADIVMKDTQIQKVSDENNSQVNQTYEALEKAFLTNDAKDLAEARELVEALSPTNRVRLFVRMARNFYYANYLDFSNAYFNINAYLKANPDVAAKARTAEDPMLYALEHYLDTGIYDGRSSQTSFDPIVAILLDPDCVFAVMEKGVLTPDIIREEFVKRTGIKKTEEYIVLWTAPKDDKGVYSEEPFTHSLYLAKMATGEETVGSLEEYQGDCGSSTHEPSGSDGSSDQAGDNNPAPIPENPSFVNKKASKIDPYELFFDVSSASKQVGTLSGAGPNGADATVTYYGQTYETIKNERLSEQKDYTFMIYMCGSNQESDSNYVRVSKQLLSMLKAGDLQNINVLVCIGGSPSFQNDYMNGTSNEEDGIINDGVGIYYLDGSAISSAYENLSAAGKTEFDNDFVSMTYVPLSRLRNAFEAINQDTFKKVAQISSIDMGDPGVLSGFINLATELFPASNYGLSLSNHGGGLEAGVCVSSSSAGIKGTAIMAEELESAMRATSLYSNNQKLGTLFYDACLMSSAEIAYSLKDYYEYMLASEEVTLGETDYETLLKAISAKSTSAGDVNKEVTLQMLNAYSDTDYHQGQSYYLNASTLSVFSSEQIDKAVVELNDAALLMQEALENSDFRQNDIDKKLLEATRMALLSCADYNDEAYKRTMAYRKATETKNVVDMGEFVGYLIKNINQIIEETPVNGDSSVQNKLIEIRAKLLEAASDGESIDGKSYIWMGVPIIADGKVTEEYKKLRGDDVKTSGISVVIPGTDALGDQYASYFDYEGSPLKGYYDFITKYYEYIDDSSRKEQIDLLTNELESADYTKLLIPVMDSSGNAIQSLSTDSDSPYISFKVADSYYEAGLEVPEHSFGSPMQDIIETAYSIDISVVHQEKYDIIGETGTAEEPDTGVVGTLKVDLLCGEATVDPNSVSFDNGTVSFSTKNLSKVVTGYKLSGEAASGTEENGDTWQYVLASEYEKDPAKKAELLAQFSIMDENYVSYFLFVKGTAKIEIETESGAEIETIDGVQHVFLESPDGYYEYSGTLVINETDSAEGRSITIDGDYDLDQVKEISAYHYVLVNENEGTDNDPKYVKKCLETDYADYGISSGYYSVTEDGGPTISVIYITQLDDDGKYSIDNNGYVLSISNETSDTAYSYSDISKFAGYDTAADSGNGLLVVKEEGTCGSLEESGLDVSKETNHENDIDDGMSQASEETYESNLTLLGKNEISDEALNSEEGQPLEATEENIIEEVADVAVEENIEEVIAEAVENAADAAIDNIVDIAA